MDDLSKKTVCVVDNGLFIELASRLSRDFGKVFYFSEWRSAFPRRADAAIGLGVEGVIRIFDLFDYLDDIELFIFPDIYHADLQGYLRSMGKRVWGSGDAEWLELDRWATRQKQETLGISGPKTQRVIGLPALTELVNATQNKWIKTSTFRGDMETWHHITPFMSHVQLAELGKKLGPFADVQEFIVEDDVPGIEIGYDGYTVDGTFPDKSLWGFEVKDAAYIGCVLPYSQLPQQIRDVNQAFAPILMEGRCRSFVSFEMRIGRDRVPVMIDPCLRCGSPCTEAWMELYENLAEIFWEGATGNLVSPKPIAKYAVQAMMHSKWAIKNWTPIKFPPEVRRWVKFRNLMVQEGHSYFVPSDVELPEIGAVVGLGDTLEEAIAKCKAVAEQVEGYDVEIKTDSLEAAQEAIEEAKGYGIEFDAVSEVLQPQPIIILEAVQPRRGVLATPANLPLKIGSFQDWDATQAIMIGVCDNDVFPAYVPDWKDPYGKRIKDGGEAGQRVADANPAMHAKAIEQLEALCELLEKEGVTVYRPPLLSPELAAHEPVGLEQQYCRELYTVIGQTVVVNQMRAPHRNKEHVALEPFFTALEAKGVKVIRPPKSTLEPNLDYRGDPRVFIEGGDIYRFGKNIMVTHSGLASSLAGIRWLAEQLPEVKVWPVDLSKEWFHGDYVFCAIKEGLAVAHLPAFVNGLPPFLKGWEIVKVSYEEANDTFACNGLSIRPGVIIIPQGSPRVARELERRGCTVVEIPFDGASWRQGGIDCCSNELLEG